MTAASLHRGVRVRRWPVDPATAHLVPLHGRPLSVADVRSVLAQLAGSGYHRARTAALAPDEARPFLAAGFDVHEHLHLLGHDLADLPRPAPPGTVRRGRRRDRPAVLTVDALAFTPPWRLDAAGLRDALAATPVARLRVAVADDDVVGYSVTGRAGPRGYLQRVAVHPTHTGRGLGRALVADALAWLVHRGATSALVNTQEGNEAALALYRTTGWRPRPEGLDVLGTALR